MHSIPFEHILQCAKNILMTDRVKSELKQITLDNGTYNFDLLYIVSLNGQTQVDDSLCKIRLFLEERQLYILDNGVSGLYGDYIPITSHTNLFVDRVTISDYAYNYTLLAYVFEKY